jgi:hypothetical protein
LDTEVFDAVAEETGHVYPEKWDPSAPKRFRLNLPIWLADFRSLAESGGKLKEILSTRFLLGPDSREKSAINNIREDDFSLFRFQVKRPGEYEKVGEFSGSLERLKDVRPNEIFYVTYFSIKLKDKDKEPEIPFYAMWRKESNEWRIVEFVTLTD